MAQLADGVFVATEITISDPTRREYTFPFRIDRAAASLEVSVDDQRISPTRFSVRLSPVGQGGRVRFLTAGQTAVPVPLPVGSVIRFERNTVIEQVYERSSELYARSNAVAALAENSRRLLEEIVETLIGHANIHLNADEVQNLVENALKPFALTSGPLIATDDLADGAVTKAKLEAFLQTVADQAVLTSTISTVGRSVYFEGADRLTRHEVELPGLTVEGAGGILGDTDSVVTIQFQGNVLTATRTGNKVVVEVDVQAQHVDPHIDDHPKIVELEAFEAAMKRTYRLGSYAWRQGVTGAGVTSGIVLPSDTRDASITIGGEEGSVARLLLLPATGRGSRLTDQNSLLLAGIRVGHDNGRQLILAADSIGQQSVDVDLTEPDLEDFARRSEDKLVPPEKLGSGTRDGSKLLRDDGQWTSPPTPAQVEDFALRTSNARVPPPKLGSGTRDGTKLLRDDGQWVDPPASDSSSLVPLSAFPASPVVGQLTNIEGTIWEFVEDTDDDNVTTGTIGLVSSGMYGDANLNWGVADPFNIRALLSRAGIGTSPPASLWLELHASDGEVASLIRMDRASARDTLTQWGYNKHPGDPGFEATSGSYTAHWFSDAAKTTTQDVHAADRWEVRDRDGPISLPTDEQAEDDTDTKIYAWSPERIHHIVDEDMHTHRGGTLAISQTGVFSPAPQGQADRAITEAEFDANSAIQLGENPPNSWSGTSRTNPFVFSLPLTRQGQPIFVANQNTSEWLYFTTDLEVGHRNRARGRTPNRRGRLIGPGAQRWVVVTGARVLTSFAPEDFDLEVLTAAQYTALTDKLDTTLYFVTA